MSHRIKTNSDVVSCEKYLNKILRQENMYTTKKSPAPKTYQDKLSHVIKSGSMPKPKSNFRQTSPIQKNTAQVLSSVFKDQGDIVNESRVRTTSRQRSTSRSHDSKDREAWGQLLHSNRSKEKVSTFSNFDPLRTLHFLSKELKTKLIKILPEDDDILQMIADIHHALKRIPPEISSFLHNPNIEYPHSDISGYTAKLTSNRGCQTPATLYQEDSEKFQKIMEENTYRLEASCKQLEMVCTNLQNEKEMTEKELDEARENVELLCKRVKDLEHEMEELSNMKIKQLEEEKVQLQEELEKAIEEINNNPTMNQLKKLVEELKKQKRSSDETCARLEYDMTLLKMEKEKFVTMLAVRDREIKDIQEEMAKIQEHVTKELKKLNSDVVKRCSSMKIISEPPSDIQQNVFVEIGDTTVSSITTNESEKEPIVILKESPECGDAKDAITLEKESKDDFLEKFKANNVDNGEAVIQDADIVSFDDLLKGLTPSMQALLLSHNL